MHAKILMIDNVLYHFFDLWMYFKSTFIVTLWVLANSIDTCLVPKSRLIDIINRKYELKELLGSGFLVRSIERLTEIQT